VLKKDIHLVVVWKPKNSNLPSCLWETSRAKIFKVSCYNVVHFSVFSMIFNKSPSVHGLSKAVPFHSIAMEIVSYPCLVILINE
jgi:hypothetical protein